MKGQDAIWIQLQLIVDYLGSERICPYVVRFEWDRVPFSAYIIAPNNTWIGALVRGQVYSKTKFPISSAVSDFYTVRTGDPRPRALLLTHFNGVTTSPVRDSGAVKSDAPNGNFTDAWLIMGGRVAVSASMSGPSSAPLNGPRSWSAVVDDTLGYIYEWQADAQSIPGGNRYEISHSFGTVGSHLVRAIVTWSDYSSDTVSRTVLVTFTALAEGPGTIAEFTEATWTATPIVGFAPFSYQWYVDDVPVDGETSDSFTRTLSGSGISHLVQVRVTDARGNTAWGSRQVFVSGGSGCFKCE